MNSALLSECLRELSAKLDLRDILLSDAILNALKVLRIHGNESCNFSIIARLFAREMASESRKNGGKKTHFLKNRETLVSYRYLTGFG